MLTILNLFLFERFNMTYAISKFVIYKLVDLLCMQTLFSG